jgi:RNA polymerase sigma-70 factor (ECF subfamily)
VEARWGDGVDVEGEPVSVAEGATTAEALTRDVLAAVPELYRYAIRLTGGDRPRAEDLVQETCLAAVRHARSEPGEVIAMGWLVVVLRRRYIDQLRRDRRESKRLMRHGVDEPSTEPDWAAVGGGAALAALGTLAPRQRVALVLRYVDDLPVQAVAELLELSIAATESLLARGRRELARRLGGDGDG